MVQAHFQISSALNTNMKVTQNVREDANVKEIWTEKYGRGSLCLYTGHLFKEFLINKILKKPKNMKRKSRKERITRDEALMALDTDFYWELIVLALHVNKIP